MNPMDALRDARPEFLDTATPAATRLRELDLAMARQRPGPAKRRFRPAWGLGALVAGAAAAAVLISGGGGQPVPPPAVQGPISLDGRDALLAAAAGSEKQPATSGKWWHSAGTTSMVVGVEGAEYRVLERSRYAVWTPSSPSGEIHNLQQRLGFGFPSDADEAAWKAAGSPRTVTIVPPKGKLGGYELSRADGTAASERQPVLKGGYVFWLGRNVTVAELAGLPGGKKALKASLLRWYRGHDTEAAGVPMGSDAWLFRVSVGLIADMPVSPRVRGAAFRMLADLKTVRVTPDVRTADGRTGTAVSIAEQSRTKDGGTGRNDNRLIFDLATGTPLQTDSVVVDPGTGNQQGLPAGTVWTATTLTTSGWTDRR